MSFKLIFGITVCSSFINLASQTFVNGDYVPQSQEEAQYPGIYKDTEANDDKNKDGSLKSPLQDMTHAQMMENRKTKHYDDFVNGVFVNLIELVTHTLTGHPLVQ